MASYNFDDNNSRLEKNSDDNVTDKKHHKKNRKFISASSDLKYQNPKKLLAIGIIITFISIGAFILIFTTFNSTNGYAPVNAVISNIIASRAYVDFTVNGKKYSSVELNVYYSGMHVGQSIEVYYYIEDPSRPAKVVNAVSKTVPPIVAGVFLAVGATFTTYSTVRLVKNKKSKITNEIKTN